MNSYPLFDRAALTAAFTMLGERLAQRRIVADVYIVGGAAMMLAYDSRRATRDVDALFTPHGVVLEEAAFVAGRLGLPRSWINEQASVYISTKSDQEARPVFEHPGLRVSAASPRHLLAMKILSARRYADLADTIELLRILRITTVDDVERICADVFPQEPLTDKSRLFAEDALDAVTGTPRDAG
ncbi:DUF6036 family nucleotidyltransferase [Frankia sp. Cr2]|uniref:DUF6036 family nucleotidyltransferase n=1 Tax=Frankia sp. Cr2 TaxID=3073932 RepID=UPI002AD53311|nr:DUF6036 family nucleotidyltransferase [Frankia sp. Cr2]